MRGPLFAALAATGLLLGAVPALAADTTAGSQPAASSDQSGADEVVCMSAQAPTGSRVPPGKVCHTRLEWAELRASGADQLQLYDHNMPTQSPNAPVGGSGAMGGRPH